MTNVNVSSDLISVYDSTDNTNEVIRLSVVASQVLQRRIKVYGVGILNGVRKKDCIPLVPYGIYICYNDAKEALASLYMQRGMTRSEARSRVGLV